MLYTHALWSDSFCFVLWTRPLPHTISSAAKTGPAFARAAQCNRWKVCAVWCSTNNIFNFFTLMVTCTLCESRNCENDVKSSKQFVAIWATKMFFFFFYSISGCLLVVAVVCLWDPYIRFFFQIELMHSTIVSTNRQNAFSICYYHSGANNLFDLINFRNVQHNVQATKHDAAFFGVFFDNILFLRNVILVPEIR